MASISCCSCTPSTTTTTTTAASNVATASKPVLRSMMVTDPSSSSSSRFSVPLPRLWAATPRSFTQVKAQTEEAAEQCNEEDCAPEKEVGKISMEWKAEEKTQVLGTFPPMKPKKEWTGFVEKDTAGQTNIYAVEPTIYVSESGISSNTAGDDNTGSEKTILVTLGLALGLIFGAEVVLQGLGSNAVGPDAANTGSYDGPSLSYYIKKFEPVIAAATSPTATFNVADEQQAPELAQADAVAADSSAAAVATPAASST